MDYAIIIDGWRQLCQANKLAFNNLNAAEQLQVTDLIRATINYQPETTSEVQELEGIVNPEEFNDE